MSLVHFMCFQECDAVNARERRHYCLATELKQTQLHLQVAGLKESLDLKNKGEVDVVLMLK